jgi:hypothetical protein
LDETAEESLSLSEQIKNEDFALAQLTAKVVPETPLLDDEQFVRKEVRRLYGG